MTTFARHAPQDDPRLAELLADRALGVLSPEDQAELEARAGDTFEPVSDFDVAAAALELAALRAHAVEAMPTTLQDRLLRSAAQWTEETQSRARFARHTQPRLQEPRDRDAGGAGVSAKLRSNVEQSPVLVSAQQFQDRLAAQTATHRPVLPWVVAAAGVALAAFAWLGRPAGPSALQGSQLAASLAALPDTATFAWGDWDNPEVKGVQGTVVWNEARQAGVMKFRNLPALAPGEQYQLWIIDSRGLADASGQSMRISGGVFGGPSDATSNQELVVPIAPALKVQGAAAFAVTIEKTGGTWVSDMKRRVVIAARS